MKNCKVEKLKKLFDKFATAEYSYDRHMELTNHLSAQERLLSRFYKHIKGRGLESRCLDIATGTGTIARLIAENTNAEVYGIDFSKDMIDVAKENAEKEGVNIKFEVANAKNIPYKNNYFDVVTCCYGMYWFYNKVKVITEIKRVLKPNGNVILMEEDFKESQKPVFSKMAPYLKKLVALEKFVHYHKIKEMIKEQGFCLSEEIREANDKFHDTVGMYFVLKGGKEK